MEDIDRVRNGAGKLAEFGPSPVDLSARSSRYDDGKSDDDLGRFV
jgi:hypothetical protein